MNPLISAVITTYKRPPLIVKRAIESVLSQTYTNIELIVVDDSPTDFELREDVKELVQLYENVTYIQHNTSRGACEARNTGLVASRGEYIAYLDDDDEWLPTKIEKQLQKFCDDNIALVYCGKKVMNEETGEIKEIQTVVHENDVFDELILENFIGSTSFPLLRKKSLEEIGGFDPIMKSSQDYDVWTRIASKYMVACVDEPLCIYHWHDGEQISKNPKNKIDGLERFNEKNIEYLRTHHYAWWYRTIKISPFYAQDLNIKMALLTWYRAVIKCPWKIRENIRYMALIFRNYACRRGKH